MLLLPYWLGHGCRRSRVQPSSEPLPQEFENRAPILDYCVQPSETAHLRKIDSPEAQPCNKNIDAITQRLVIQRIHGPFDCLRTVGISPADANLTVSLVDAHLQRCMSHREGNELLPVLGPGEPSGGFQSLVKGRRRQWSHQAENRQTRRPGANFLQSSFGDASAVIVHAKYERA